VASDVSENEIGNGIIAAAMKVYSAVGPGLLESAYEACLACDLEKRGFRIRKQVLVPVRFEELTIDAGYRADILVEERVVVELKAVAAILPVYRARLLSYLRLD
jgi:GxxExxY protein